MSYFGAYFGGGGVVVAPPPVLVPIEAVFATTDPARVDHAAVALSRLPEQFRRRRV